MALRKASPLPGTSVTNIPKTTSRTYRLDGSYAWGGTALLRQNADVIKPDIDLITGDLIFGGIAGMESGGTLVSSEGVIQGWKGNGPVLVLVEGHFFVLSTVQVTPDQYQQPVRFYHAGHTKSSEVGMFCLTAVANATASINNAQWGPKPADIEDTFDIDGTPFFINTIIVTQEGSSVTPDTA